MTGRRGDGERALLLTSYYMRRRSSRAFEETSKDVTLTMRLCYFLLHAAQPLRGKRAIALGGRANAQIVVLRRLRSFAACAPCLCYFSAASPSPFVPKYMQHRAFARRSSSVRQRFALARASRLVALVAPAPKGLCLCQVPQSS